MGSHDRSHEVTWVTHCHVVCVYNYRKIKNEEIRLRWLVWRACQRHLVTWAGCLDRLNIRNHILSEAYRNNLNSYLEIHHSSCVCVLFEPFESKWESKALGPSDLVDFIIVTHLDKGDPYKYTSNCIKLFSHIIFKFLNTPFCPYHFWPIRTLEIITLHSIMNHYLWLTVFCLIP